MSSCGIDDNDVIKGIVDEWIENNIDKLKALFCCDDGGGGGGTPGTDLHIVGLEATTRRHDETGQITGYVITAKRSDGKAFSAGIDAAGDPGAPGNDIHISDFEATVELASNDAGQQVKHAKFVVMRSDGQKWEKLVELPPYVTGASFTQDTRVLSITMSDGNKVDVTIPGGGGGGVPGSSSISRIETDGMTFTIHMTDGSSHSGTLTAPVTPDNDTKIREVKVEGGELIVVDTAGSEFKVQLPAGGAADGNTKIQSVEFQGNEIIITDTDGQQHKAELPAGQVDTNTKIQAFTADAAQKTLTITDTDGQQFTANLTEMLQGLGGGGAADGNTKIQSFETRGNELVITDTDGGEFKTVAPAAPPAPFTGSQASPETTNETPIPTTMAGGRDMLLGKPYKWVEVQVDGELCLMPVWKKP